ncbi:MAG: NUDIX hydrolase [Bacteroidetes bacterium]|nr:MAG: NUDIX hydrolase [Bacteroidota bacterium]
MSENSNPPFEAKPESPWKTHAIREVYDNPWIRVTHREVSDPSGAEGIYGVVHFKNVAIAAVPLDEELNTYLVGQYRYTLDAYSWEVPEGGGPLGTDPLENARRELLEETGLVAQEWRLVAEMDLSNSVTDERGMVFVARRLSQHAPQPESTELLRVRKLPFHEALDMALRGEIRDALSLIALMKVQLLLERGEL